MIDKLSKINFFSLQTKLFGDAILFLEAINTNRHILDLDAINMNSGPMDFDLGTFNRRFH